MSAALLLSFFLAQAITPEGIEHAKAGAAAMEQRKLDVAIREFRKAAELMPDSASGYANLGDAYFKNGDFDKAVPELEHALRLNPRLIGTHLTLGVVLLLEGNARAALPHLEKTQIPELLGLAYLGSGDPERAIEPLREGLAKQPADENLLYYFGRATALASRNAAARLAALRHEPAKSAAGDQPPQDVVAAQKALADHPGDPDLLLAFSRSAAAESQKAFDRVLQMGPRSARAHQILAERHAAAGRFRDAEREYAELIRLNPAAPDAHLDFGKVLAADGQAAAALEQYRAEADIHPANADAFYEAGAALLQKGDASPALKDLREADRIRPDSPPILLALGKAAAAAKDDAAAETAWKRLLTVQKDGEIAAAAHQELAKLYQRAGKRDDVARETAAYEALAKSAGH